MAEPKEVVNPAESTPAEEVNQQVEETTAETASTQESETPQLQTSPLPEGVKEGDEVDERGVSYKNRYKEYERKYNDIQQKYINLETQLPTLIQDAVVKAIPQQQAQPQYTKEELIRFKNTADNPDHRAWAELQIENLRAKETQDYFETQRKKERQEMQFANEQQMALNEVKRKYSLMFNQDGSWNNEHPLTRRVAELYNSRPTFKNDGLGLLGAADMAFADYVLQQQPQLAQKTQQLKRQVKKLEKATLSEGTGQPVPVTKKDALALAKEKYAQTGSESDLQKVILESYKKKQASGQ